MSKEKLIILDTDIGDDTDDALAMLLLLKFDNVRLLGVTTVFKNTPLRARLAKRILQLAGRGDIPVYAGYGKPYVGQPKLDDGFVQYTPEIDGDSCRPNNVDERNGDEAVDFIIDNAKRYGKDLTVLAIGPYTNIAKAYERDPKAMSGCNTVCMGGCFYEQFVEYNVAMDPEACDILFKSDMSTTFIGADVTWQAQLNDEQTRKVLSLHNDGLTGYCAELVRLWKSKCWFNPVLHDPLAAYYVIDDSICTTEQVWSEVELKGEHTRGLTVNIDHFFKYLQHKTPGKKRIRCAKTVDADRFISIFLHKTFET